MNGRESMTRQLSQSATRPACTIALLGAILAGGLNSSADAALITFDPPGSTYTWVYGLNGENTAVGVFVDGNNLTHGFMRTVDGTISPIDVEQSKATRALNINDKGSIVGSYWTGKKAGCFIRHPDGRISKFFAALSEWCSAVAINKHGVITGTSSDNTGTVYHGFVRDHGTTTLFDIGGGNFVFPVGINESGVIAGQFIDTQSMSHGFVRAADGTIATFDVPNSSGTAPYSINAKGEVVGTYVSADRKTYSAFEREPDGTFVTFRLGPNRSEYTEATDINDRGRIVGSFQNKQSGQSGFVRSADGQIVRHFQGPEHAYTYPTRVSRSGAVVGIYNAYGEMSHGFILMHQ